MPEDGEHFLPKPAAGDETAPFARRCDFAIPVPVDVLPPHEPVSPQDAVQRICDAMRISPSEPMNWERHAEFADRLCLMLGENYCPVRSRIFGPFSPILPVPVEVDEGRPRPKPRRWDYPVGWGDGSGA